MKSPHDLELTAAWVRETLLREAATERLAQQLRHGSGGLEASPAFPRSRVRLRLARSLYALADWLSREAPVDGRLKTA